MNERCDAWFDSFTRTADFAILFHHPFDDPFLVDSPRLRSQDHYQRTLFYWSSMKRLAGSGINARSRPQSCMTAHGLTTVSDSGTLLCMRAWVAFVVRRSFPGQLLAVQNPAGATTGHFCLKRLNSVGGSKTQAAKILKIDRKTLRERLKRLETGADHGPSGIESTCQIIATVPNGITMPNMKSVAEFAMVAAPASEVGNQ